MKIININGVDCYVFFEYLAPDKGVIINTFIPIDARVPIEDRKYVSHKNWIGVGKDVSEVEQLAVREQAKITLESLVAADVASLLDAAKETSKPASTKGK